MLTKKQKDLLMFIHNRVQETGVSPSFDEMKDALELKSKSGIHRLITALEERGFLRRLPHRARALEILKLPTDHAVEAHAVEKETPLGGERSVGGRSDADISKSGEVLPFPSGAAPEPTGVEVPVMGRIAAGVPISAIQDHTNDVVVAPDMLGAGSHYALEVHGDSMVDEGILDGDTVLIKETSSCRDGDIVVAFIKDEEEATLKKIYKKGRTVELVAANPAYEPRQFAADNVAVQGQLVGLVRRYH